MSATSAANGGSGSAEPATDRTEMAPYPVIELDADGQVLHCNPAARALADAAFGDASACDRLLPADLTERLAAGSDSAAAESQAGEITISWRFQRNPTADSIVAFGFDVTEWRRSDAARSRKDALLHALAGVAHIILNAPQDEVPFASVLEPLGEATGVSRLYVFRNHRSADGDLLASQVAEWTQSDIEPQIDNSELQDVPYDAAGMGRWARELARGNTIAGTLADFPPEEQEMLEPQGIKSLVVTPILVDEEAWGFIGFDDCAVERRWAPAELDILRAAADIVASAIARREALDALEHSRDQLRHAQRMEAIGRLAGGIAHDFNNILAGILGNAELLLVELQPGDAARDDIDEIRRSALRAAALTRQLLAFSRKQSWEPSAVSLSDLLAEMEGLLRRLIGEDVTIESRVEPGVPPVWADPSHLEQIVMNLVVNARDAMPSGGRVTLGVQRAGFSAAEAAARSLDPGREYVLIWVDDTGEGMDEKTQERAFEPFFTTKDTGTGMGLSIIYGITRQCGGSAWIRSRPNEGTRVTIALPVSEEHEAVAVEELNVDTGMFKALSGPETVLVVEDDEAVRSLIRRILRSADYQVVTASTAREGIDKFRDRAQDVSLLVTDVGLPDRSGTELASICEEMRPGLPVLYISGFPGRRASGEVFADDVSDFLAKPFTRAQLLSEVRARLDSE